MKNMGRVAMVLAVAGMLTFTAMQAWATSPVAPPPGWTESKEFKAKCIMADDMYNIKNFVGAVEQALAARSMLGSWTTSRIESLLARAYVGMNKPIQAYEALERYLKLANESDKDYAELTALYANVKVEVEKEKAEEAQRQMEKAASYLKNIEMIKIPAGCLGDTFGDGQSNERSVHKVCLDAFSMGKFEVTQGLWTAVMGSNPAGFKKGLDYPVENVSWNDVQEFIKALNARLGKTFRLPTEAEWEYACRSGGKKEKYCGGDNIDELAWWGTNSGYTTHPVGQKSANGLGIHDMSGNVYEWVQDYYAEYDALHNPAGVISSLNSSSARILCGSSWNGIPNMYNPAFRSRGQPDISSNDTGFRLAMSISPEETATPDAGEKQATGWNW